MIVVALAARTALADAPAGMVEIPTTQPPVRAATATPAAEPKAFAIGPEDASVVSTMEGRRSLSLLVGSRVLCLGAPSFCMAGAQVAFGFRYGDIHVGVVDTPSGGGNFNSAYLAPYGGFELGSRYYYLARWGQRTPFAFGLAARGAIEFMDVMPYASDHVYSGYFGFASTHGVNAALLAGRHLGLYARAAVGVGVRAPTSSFTNESATAGFAIDASLGFQARF